VDCARLKPARLTWLAEHRRSRIQRNSQLRDASNARGVRHVAEKSLAGAHRAHLVNHIGVDRLLGYGLKYTAGFGWTHLGKMGRGGKESIPTARLHCALLPDFGMSARTTSETPKLTTTP